MPSQIQGLAPGKDISFEITFGVITLFSSVGCLIYSCTIQSKDRNFLENISKSNLTSTAAFCLILMTLSDYGYDSLDYIRCDCSIIALAINIINCFYLFNQIQSLHVQHRADRNRSTVSFLSFAILPTLIIYWAKASFGNCYIIYFSIAIFFAPYFQAIANSKRRPNINHSNIILQKLKMSFGNFMNKKI